ncbi:MFS transporter [Streptomyces yaizuensis]|uniref:MFS transporter n=1 Tax=Streptomyces yaizuensis TaxID=2989713 RepID=A0ABQ5P863_9ACTN|nr:MFS transporter [Streptomyces sp. YSPA8]GLF98784.1 MFS transporter [Streptomyces sp. YSPA8]
MRPARSRGLIPRPLLFWSGVVICSGGVVEHLRMFVHAAEMDFHMAHMGMGAGMWVAMAAIVAGLVLAGFGLVPRRPTAGETPAEPATVGTPAEPAAVGPAADSLPAPAAAVSPARRATLRRRLIAVLSFALVVDQLKPATLAFIMPGARAEFGLTSTEVALLPMGGLTGTVLGSLLWGHLADRIGRRAAVLLAALLFVATTVCGAMPSFEASVLMCLLMGMSAGGMLPIVYALMSEVLPGRHGLMVLTAGLTTVGGYLAASGLASVFEPLYSWRVLWFLQLPLALALLALNRWIPESPSFLASQGRMAESRRMADLFGLSTAPPEPRTDRGVGALLGPDHRRQTLIISGFALSWGFVHWGFVTFLPTVLAETGTSIPPSRILFGSSLLSIPGTVLAAWLYSRWSSRRTMTLYGAITALSLAALTTVPLNDAKVAVPVLIGLLTGTSGVVAVLGPYTAQVYPTAFRGLGSGLSAACSKSGGIFGPPLVGWMMSWLSIGRVATVIAIPMALATASIARYGKELVGPRTGADDGVRGPDRDRDPGPGPGSVPDQDRGKDSAVSR